MRTIKRYKFLREGLKSEYGDHRWVVGEWYKYDGDLELCKRGFHCSKGIYQAFSFVQGELLAEVEVSGKHIKEKDKEVWSEMRITKVWEWEKRDSVLFSIYAARLVLDIFEKIYPNDNRPRKAIEAAEKYIDSPTEENRSAAESAAWSVTESAWSEAWSVAESARSAARSAAESEAWLVTWSARSAASWSAWSAARSASESAAESARSAAESAAESAVYKKLDRWMKEHIKELKELK